MTMLDQLEGIWNAIEQESGQLPGTYQRRVPDGGVLTSYAALVRPEGRRRIVAHVLASACNQLNLPTSGKGFELVVEHQPPSEYAVLHLEERTSAGNAIFSMVCADLISASKSSADASTASLLFCNRLIAWKRFFESKGEQGITRDEYVGLWGELYLMGEMIGAGTPPSDALRAWLGPIGAPQDYSFGTRAIEVKTSVSAEMGLVHISNVMQLDDSPLSNLHLVCLHCDFRPDGGMTMSELCDRISEQLGPALSNPLTDCLVSRGLAEPDRSPWANWGFTVMSVRAYAVQGAFPRFRVNDVPQGAVDVAYAVQLGACAPYGVDLSTVLAQARFGDRS
jgi:hypothetical protein